MQKYEWEAGKFGWTAHSVELIAYKIYTIAILTRKNFFTIFSSKYLWELSTGIKVN